MPRRNPGFRPPRISAPPGARPGSVAARAVQRIRGFGGGAEPPDPGDVPANALTDLAGEPLTDLAGDYLTEI